jgi:hypothetical protein
MHCSSKNKELQQHPRSFEAMSCKHHAKIVGSKAEIVEEIAKTMRT